MKHLLLSNLYKISTEYQVLVAFLPAALKPLRMKLVLCLRRVLVCLLPAIGVTCVCRLILHKLLIFFTKVLMIELALDFNTTDSREDGAPNFS